MEIKDYPRDFVGRTIKLLKNNTEIAKKDGLEVTFFLNCLLGLIVSTSENLDRCKSRFFEKRICDVEIIEFIPEKVAQIDFSQTFRKYVSEVNKKSLIGQLHEKFNVETAIEIQKYKLVKNLTLHKFLKKIRNGVAHQNISPTNQKGEWKGLRIWNHNSYGIKDFEVEFTINQLKDFAIFIGEKYLEETK